MDFERMLKLVTDTGFRGYCGIEYGGYAGLNATRERFGTPRALRCRRGRLSDVLSRQPVS